MVWDVNTKAAILARLRQRQEGTVWDAKRMRIAIKIKTLRDGGFTNKEIIDIKKADQVDALTKEA